MADIFLSYKREDREKVRRLAEALQSQGWSVWWDSRIGAGETWDRVIEAELEAAQCVLVVWSMLSVDSDWVRQEAREGRERGCLLPVGIDAVRPPLEFRSIQSVDLSRWRGELSDPSFANVCAGVERILNGTQRAPGAGTSSRPNFKAALSQPIREQEAGAPPGQTLPSAGTSRQADLKAAPLQSSRAEAGKEANPLVKLLIDLGPLVAFFVTYARSGIYWATGVLMVATIVALVASRALLGRFSVAPLVTGVLVVVFGGLTFWLEDPRFIMMKPTIINLLFAGILAFGLITGRPLLKLVMGEAFRLTDEGWHKLTVRWVVFFVMVALLNEVVWRNFSEATWVTFKAWGILPLTLIFAVLQIGLIKRYEAKSDA